MTPSAARRKRNQMPCATISARAVTDLSPRVGHPEVEIGPLTEHKDQSDRHADEEHREAGRASEKADHEQVKHERDCPVSRRDGSAAGS